MRFRLYFDDACDVDPSDLPDRTMRDDSMIARVALWTDSIRSTSSPMIVTNESPPTRQEFPLPKTLLPTVAPLLPSISTVESPVTRVLSNWGLSADVSPTSAPP